MMNGSLKSLFTAAAFAGVVYAYTQMKAPAADAVPAGDNVVDIRGIKQSECFNFAVQNDFPAAMCSAAEELTVVADCTPGAGRQYIVDKDRNTVIFVTPPLTGDLAKKYMNGQCLARGKQEPFPGLGHDVDIPAATPPARLEHA